jgi:hypothetical protein
MSSQGQSRGRVASCCMSWHISIRRALSVICVLVIALISSAANAQQVYGSIDGNVSDSSGAALPHAAVTITETTKDVVFHTTTNDAGFYSEGQLIPGNYTVTVEASGFKKVVSEPLIVRIDNVTRLNVTLAVGASTDTVQVTSAAPLLETDRADVATTLTSRDILALPDYQRSVLALEFLVPGVMVNSSVSPTAENPQGSFRARVNGRIYGATGYLLDGTDNQDAWLGLAVINPNPDSVAEAKFSTQNFDAENGYVAGGMFAFSTKSGSNQLHGSLFEYLVNNSPGFRTVGADPFTQPDGAPPLKSNQFGGSLGGRIIPNKLFFFGDAQIQRRREDDTVLTTVPTQKVRDTCLTNTTGFCDLSDYIGTYTIYDPATGNQSTGQSRTEFKNNQIPYGRLSQQAINILNYYPAPNITPSNGVNYVNNYIAQQEEVFNAQQYDTREDYYLNDKNLFFGRYTYASFDLSAPGAFGAVAGGPGIDSTGYSGTSTVHNQSLSLGYTHVFSPSSVNELRFGFYKYNVHEIPGGYGTDPAAQAGIPGLNLDNTVTSGMPAFYIGGISDLGYSKSANNCNCTLTEVEHEYEVVDNFSKVVGNHALKFGADLRHTSNLRVPSDSHRSGELTFASGYTGLGNANGAATHGLGLATFLLGETTTFSRYVSNVTDATAYLERAHFYGQDTWHVTPKLTVSYGLRWELTFPEATDPGKGGLLDLSTGNVVVFGIGGNSSRGFQQMNYTNFAPRLGVAYQLTPTTVVRLGYGWAYDIGDAGIIFNEANISLPVIVQQSNTPINATQGIFTLAGGPPTITAPAPNSAGQIPLPVGVTGNTRPRKITLSTTYAYNATIQHEFNKFLSVTAGYVGNSGRHVPVDESNDFDVNQAAFVPGVTNLNLSKPYYAKYGWTQAIDDFCNCAVAQYNSLQASFDLRTYHGYTARGTYLYQHAYGDAGSAFTMLYDRPLGYGNQEQFPHTQVIVTQIYDLPFGKGKLLGRNAGAALNALIGGWNVSGTSTFQSGQNYTVTIGTYPSGYANPSEGPAYPNVGTTSPYAGAAHNRTQWYQGCSTASLSGGTCGGFALPAPNTFGNFGFNNLYGPSFSIRMWRCKSSLRLLRTGISSSFARRRSTYSITPISRHPTQTSQARLPVRLRALPLAPICADCNSPYG